MRIRPILAAAILAVAFSTLAHAQATRTRNLRVVDASAQDEERLKQLVREWADAVVHNDLQKLDAIREDGFKGATEGRKELRQAHAARGPEVVNDEGRGVDD
jgi:hypothetical protein